MARVVGGEGGMDLEQLHNEIDHRVNAAEAQIVSQMKAWFLTGLLGLLATSIAGFASLMFVIGQLSERFDRQIESMTQMQTSNQNISKWMDRKDALDDELIRWAKEKGYAPPAWYSGKDSDQTGK